MSTISDKVDKVQELKCELDRKLRDIAKIKERIEKSGGTIAIDGSTLKSYVSVRVH